MASFHPFARPDSDILMSIDTLNCIRKLPDLKFPKQNDIKHKSSAREWILWMFAWEWKESLTNPDWRECADLYRKRTTSLRFLDNISGQCSFLVRILCIHNRLKIPLQVCMGRLEQPRNHWWTRISEFRRNFRSSNQNFYQIIWIIQI